MGDLPPGLAAWARLAGPALVLDAVRSRARRGYGTERGALGVELTPQQRREVARLLGTSWDAGNRPVTLQLLAGALIEDGFTVREFVEALDGRPLRDERALRRAHADAARRERVRVAELITGLGVATAAADTWITDPGLPRGGDGRMLALAEEIERVWRRLPWRDRPPVRLATLAGAVTRDAHALDHDKALGRATARLIAGHCGLPRPAGRGRDWRSAWAAAGILCDEVSSRVLALNVPLQGDAAAARLCAAARGEPVWLTLRSLTGGWSIAAGTTVFVCENPTVVEAAADALGARCPPLVCTDGVPSFAALDLLAGLDAARARLAVRADVDDGGFVVVDQVRKAAPSCGTWRFDAATYARHCGITVGSPDPEITIADVEQLRSLHHRNEAPLHEEALLDELLADLAAAAG